MQINDEEFEDFRKYHKEALGVELSPAEASDAANNLAELYALPAQPL